MISRDLSKSHNHVTLGQFPRLQSYLVLIETDCYQIWSALGLLWQSYVVPFLQKLQSYWVHTIQIIAIINGPALYMIYV